MSSGNGNPEDKTNKFLWNLQQQRSGTLFLKFEARWNSPGTYNFDANKVAPEKFSDLPFGYYALNKCLQDSAEVLLSNPPMPSQPTTFVAPIPPGNPPTKL